MNDAFQTRVDALGQRHLMGVEASVLMENVVLRRRYLMSVETLSNEEVHALTDSKNTDVAATASRWSRAGKIFTVKSCRAVRVPIFQLAGGRPRPEIARVLAALPECQRSGWPAAFWFASPHGFLGCSAMEALEDPARVDEVVAAVERTGCTTG